MGVLNLELQFSEIARRASNEQILIETSKQVCRAHIFFYLFRSKLDAFLLPAKVIDAIRKAYHCPSGMNFGCYNYRKSYSTQVNFNLELNATIQGNLVLSASVTRV